METKVSTETYLKCPHCNKYASSKIIISHTNTCDEAIIFCSLLCGKSMKRCEYQAHKKYDCPANYAELYIEIEKATIRQKDIARLFESKEFLEKPLAGEIKAIRIANNHYNPRQNHAFVTFNSSESARYAETELSGKEIDGKKLIIAKSKHCWREIINLHPGNWISITNPTPDMTEDTLFDIFSVAGTVTGAFVVCERTGAAFKFEKHAYVCFASYSDVNTAIWYCLDKKFYGGNITISKCK